MVLYNWRDGTIWQHPTHVARNDYSVTLEDSRLIWQLPYLYGLDFMGGDMSGLSLDGIENCQELCYFRFVHVTQFPVNEIPKLAACPIKVLCIESKDTHLKDSDLEVFAKFSKLETLRLICINSEITDAGLECFATIPSLKELCLSKTSVTQEGIDEFQKKRPDVKIYFE